MGSPGFGMEKSTKIPAYPKSTGIADWCMENDACRGPFSPSQESCISLRRAAKQKGACNLYEEIWHIRKGKYFALASKNKGYLGRLIR
jgi:hypothetical protein